MTVLELYHQLEDLDNNLEVEFSFKIKGFYPDDSTTEYVKITEIHHNKARNTIVFE